MRAVHTTDTLAVTYMPAFVRERVLPALSTLLIFALATLALLYFRPLLAAWLLILAALTYLRPVYGAAALLLIVSIDTAQPLFGKIFVSFSELEFAACLVALLAAKRFSNLAWRPILWGSPFIAAVFLSGVINITWYKVVPHTLRVSELIFALFFASNVFREKAAPRVFRWALAISCIFYCSAGLIQYDMFGAMRIYSFFTNANQFSGYLNLLLPFFSVFFFVTGGERIRLLWAYLVVLTVITQLGTGSRSGFLSAASACLVLWTLVYYPSLRVFFKSPVSIANSSIFRKVLDIVTAILIIGVIVLAHLMTLHYLAISLTGKLPSPVSVSHPFQPIQGSLQNASGRSAGGISASISSDRLPFYRLGGQIWKDHLWFGIGPGNYSREVEKRWAVVEEYKGGVGEMLRAAVRIHAHNLYLQLGVEYGIVGLLAFLFLIGSISKRLIATQFQSVWPLAGLGILIAFLVQNLFDVTFPSLGLETGLLLGTSLIMEVQPSKPKLRCTS